MLETELPIGELTAQKLLHEGPHCKDLLAEDGCQQAWLVRVLKPKGDNSELQRKFTRSVGLHQKFNKTVATRHHHEKTPLPMR